MNHLNKYKLIDSLDNSNRQILLLLLLPPPILFVKGWQVQENHLP